MRVDRLIFVSVARRLVACMYLSFMQLSEPWSPSTEHFISQSSSYKSPCALVLFVRGCSSFTYSSALIYAYLEEHIGLLRRSICCFSR